MQFLWIVPSGALAAQVVHGGYAVQGGPVCGLRLALESVASAESADAKAIAAAVIAARATPNVLALMLIGTPPILSFPGEGSLLLASACRIGALVPTLWRTAVILPLALQLPGIVSNRNNSID